jgi:phosphinothricin acetyltransferase
MDVVYRHAEAGDIERITAIYNTVIVDSHVSFDEAPHTVEERAAWFATKTVDGMHQAWVCEADGEVVGVAYSTPWKPKTGYAHTVETTIVFEPAVTGRGLGEGLMTKLLDAVTAAGAEQAIAVVALPNDPSVKFHHRMGYRTVGVLEDVGTKLGARWSTEILQKRLSGSS